MKRKRSVSEGTSPRKSNRGPLQADASLSDLSNETILQILKLLSHQDLCQTQLVDRRFARLATDPLIWKSLYQRDYAARRSRVKPDLRETKQKRTRRLGTISDQDHERRSVLDWKLRYMIRYNWVHGRCHTTETNFVQSMVPDYLSADNDSLDGVVSKTTLSREDLERLGLTGLEGHTTRVVGLRHAMVFCEKHLYLVRLSSNTLPAQLVYSLEGSAAVQCHNEFLALLTDKQRLLIIDLSEEKPKTIVSFIGLASDVSQLGMRTTHDMTLVSLVSVESGLIDNVLRIQEIGISNETRKVDHNRNAKTHFIGRSQWNALKVDTICRPEYEHPFLLVPVDTRIALFHVRSTPKQLDIEFVKTLHGCTAAIKSCRVNRDVLFVIATGLAASRVWDMAMRDDIFGTQISTNAENGQPDLDRDLHHHALHSNSILDITDRCISIRRDRLDETAKNSALAGQSSLVVHDFAHATYE